MKYSQHLQELGLTHDQAALYEVLITEGPQGASRLARIAGTNRTLTYKLLGELIKAGLVEKNDDIESSSIFIAKHPFALQDLIEDKFKMAEESKVALDGVLSKIISDYNKVSGQPGVRILEGEEGMREALAETLESGETICTYADITTIKGKIGKINAEYVKDRIAKKVHKNALIPNTKENIELAKSLNIPYTEIRVIAEQDTESFTTAMEIYNNTVSYLTFTNDVLIATLIGDEAVYKMHKYLFNDAWERAIKLA